MTPDPTGFVTDRGIAVPAVTTDQMREVDRIAIEETGPNLFQMMENAGRNLARHAIDVLGSGWERARIVVLSGTGGNGGGGICAARHLANRRAHVTLVLLAPDSLSEVPRFQRKVFQAAGGTEAGPGDLRTMPRDLIIDAVIGYSLSGAPRGQAARMLRWANESSAPVLSLDVPSGVDSTTGQAYGEHIRATWTLTLALPKTGLEPPFTGDLSLADIGIPGSGISNAGTQLRESVRPLDFASRCAGINSPLGAARHGQPTNGPGPSDPSYRPTGRTRVAIVVRGRPDGAHVWRVEGSLATSSSTSEVVMECYDPVSQNVSNLADQCVG